MPGTYRGLRTRAQVGLRRPRSISRNITPGRGGTTLHYGGPRVGITASTPHAKCEQTWRAWQSFHMDGHGWSDIAYTMGACQHGYLLAGRGAGVRTAGQGHNVGNQISYALVWIGGDGDVPTADAYAAIAKGVDMLRKSGAGMRVWGHREWHSTSCPGPHVMAYAQKLDGKSVTATAAPAKTPTSVRGKFLTVNGTLNAGTVRELQAFLNAKDGGRYEDIAEDGDLGPATTRKLQWMAGANPDGDFGPESVAATEKWLGLGASGYDGWYRNLVRALQRRLNEWIKEGREAS